MANHEILITGIGAVSPYGDTYQQFVDGIMRSGISKTPIRSFCNIGYPNPEGIQVVLPDFCNTPEERILFMGERAIRAAITDWAGDLNRYRRIGMVIGSGLGLTDQLYPGYGPDHDEHYLARLDQLLSARTGLNCESIYISNACSAGSQAISYGMDLLEADDFDLIIAGGLDGLSQSAYAGFLRLYSIDPGGCRPFDKDRKGITVGEGAAFFVLENETTALREGRTIYAGLAGAGITNDGYHIVQIKPDGQAIVAAMDQALAFAGLAKEAVDLIIAHGTGTPLNDKTEAQLISSYFQDNTSDFRVTAPKSAIGHTGGASGAFGLLTAVGAIQTGRIPPVYHLQNMDPDCSIPLAAGEAGNAEIRHVLVNTFAFGGTNVIIVCTKYDGE